MMPAHSTATSTVTTWHGHACEPLTGAQGRKAGVATPCVARLWPLSPEGHHDCVASLLRVSLFWQAPQVPLIRMGSGYNRKLAYRLPTSSSTFPPTVLAVHKPSLAQHAHVFGLSSFYVPTESGAPQTQH